MYLLLSNNTLNIRGLLHKNVKFWIESISFITLFPSMARYEYLISTDMHYYNQQLVFLVCFKVCI